MPINLLANDFREPINLLAEQPSSQKFQELSPEDQAQTMQMADKQIQAQHANMPDWVRNMIMSLTPKDKPELQNPELQKIFGQYPLEAASKGISDITGYIPAIAGGLMQGTSIPIRGVASMIPSEMAQKIAQSPDLRDYFASPVGTGQNTAQLASELAGGGGLFGKLLQGAKGATSLAKIPESLQMPVALGASGYIATPGAAEDKIKGATGALALGVAGSAGAKIGEKLPQFIRGLTTKSTPEKLVEAVQKPHDILQNTADELYGQVRSAISKRNIKIPVKENYLNKIEEILPKTRATQKLIDKAKQGDYDAVHDLQSHLYKKGTKGILSDDLSIEKQGEEILGLRKEINDDLSNYLIKEGHSDIAHVLNQGKKAVAELKSTYFNPLLRKDIGKMVQKELRLIPQKPEKIFKENSIPMKRFLEKHPEVAKHAQQITDKEKAVAALDKILKKSAGVGGATFVGKTIYDLFR